MSFNRTAILYFHKLEECTINEKPKMDLVGQDGNIFFILGRASRLLKDVGQKAQAEEMFQRVTNSGSYHEALFIISEYVETELSQPQKSTKKRDQSHER
jgi:hypothetical protein